MKGESTQLDETTSDKRRKYDKNGRNTTPEPSLRSLLSNWRCLAFVTEKDKAGVMCYVIFPVSLCRTLPVIYLQYATTAVTI